MTEQLRAIFYDPKRGFVSPRRLLKRAKEAGLDVTKEQVEEFYKAQQIVQEFAPPKKQQLPIQHKSPGFIVADLVDVVKLDGPRYILTALDSYSRYAWALPVATKYARDTAPLLAQIFNDMREWGHPVRTLTVDKGGEFEGKEVIKLLSEHAIPRYVANPTQNTKRRTALIESFNRTLTSLLHRAMRAMRETDWQKILPDLIDNYNTTIHSATGLTPHEVLREGKTPEVSLRPIIDDLEIGDYVRRASQRARFDKAARNPKWGPDIFRIALRLGARYIITKPGSLELEKGAYLPSQLKKVAPPDSAPQEDEPPNPVEEGIERATTRNRFIAKQRKAGLDVDEEGNPITHRSMRPRSEKRSKRVDYSNM